MKNARLAIALCALMLLVLAAAPAAGASAAPRNASKEVRLQDQIPMDPEVTIGKLDNGLTYYIRVNRDPEKRAYVMLAVNAGSVLEDDDQVGLAHFVEHMGFNGTKHFPKQELIKYLESVGVKFGSQANAGTGFDQTVYRLTIPTDTTVVVEKAFQVLEDWARWINMEDVEIEKERGVIVEEWRLGLGAGERIFNKQLPVLLKDSRYALRLPIGNKDSLRTFKPDAARRFYRDWYRPDLMAVVAVGDFDPKWIRSLIEQHFAGMPRVERPRPRTAFPVPDHVETLYSIESDPEMTGTNITLYFKSDPLPDKTLADYRRDLVFRLHEDMFRQRLAELSQKPDPPVLGAMVRDMRIVRSKEFYFLASSVKEGGLDRGLEAMLAEVARVKKYGFIEPELKRVKERWIRVSQWADQREKVKSDTYAGQCVDHFLNGEPIVNPATQRDLYERLMPGVSLEEVNKLSGAVVRIGQLRDNRQRARERGARAPGRGRAAFRVLARRAGPGRAVHRGADGEASSRRDAQAREDRQGIEAPRARNHRVDPLERRARHSQADRFRPRTDILHRVQPGRIVARVKRRSQVRRLRAAGDPVVRGGGLRQGGSQEEADGLDRIGGRTAMGAHR